MGGETLEHSIDVTKSGGTIISILAITKEDTISKAKEKNINLSARGLQFNGDDLRAFAELMSKGIIKSRIAKTYPFTAMAEAHKQVETRRTAGKIVLRLDKRLIK